VHFALSIMYADPAQLGWDPTIVRRLCPVTHKVQYDITVHPDGAQPITYRTKQVLSDIGAEALRGRGTRVWKAVKLLQDIGDMEVTEDVHPVVIKDSWVDNDRKREGQILEEIRASAENGSVERDFLDQHLLTVLSYGDVLVEGQADTTDALHRRGKAVPLGYGKLKLNLKANLPSRSKMPVVNVTPVPDPPTCDTQDERKFIEYAAKTHHRTVFAEVGVPIYQVESLADVFLALRNLVPG
jgi:hypothetical protein